MESGRIDAARATEKLAGLREKARQAHFSGAASAVGRDVYARSAKSGKGWLSKLGRWLYKLNPSFMDRMY